MSFPVTPTPQPTDIPSQTQGVLLTNFNNLIGWAAVDHVGYGVSSAAGEHNQVTFAANQTFSAPSGNTSILYTQPGTADASAPQLFWQNSQSIFQVSPIRAWGFANTGGIIATQSYNVTSVTKTGTGTYTVALSSNAVNSANFAVIVSSIMQTNFTGGVISGYVITGTGAFQLNFRALTGAFGVDPSNFSFMVMQI
jgi:hypothetical protein